MLTVLMHEFGHLIGLDHDAPGIMAPTLVPGVRVPLDPAWLLLDLNKAVTT